MLRFWGFFLFKVASNGNWLHLHYSSKLQAKKALGKNGKVVAGNIMIGVTPCIDRVCLTCNHNNSGFLCSAQIHHSVKFTALQKK